jgi:shikimate kinase
MGTGKTEVGKRLAKRLGWRFVDVDELIETSAKMPIARLFTERGESVFRRLERRHISRIIHGCDQMIATGGGAFIDPVNRSRLRASGPVVCLTARPHVVLARVGRRFSVRPLLAGAANPLARIRLLMAQRAKAYAQADLTIDTSELTVPETVEQVWQQLGPHVCKSWRFVLDHASQLAHRYGGKYVAVADNRIVASGATQLETYRKCPPRACTQDLGIYYVPLPEEAVTALVGTA